MSIQVSPTANGVVITRSAVTHRADAAGAIAELRDQLGDTADLYAIFVSTSYDLDETATAISAWCGDRVIGCTSSGNIGPGGYDAAGISAIALSGGGVHARTISLSPLTDVQGTLEQAGPQLAELHAMWESADGFAILLVDGLSMREDRLAAGLMATLGDVPIIGGSAGDALTFSHTAVYSEGRFEADTATFTMVTLDGPFELFRLQHHEPTDQVLVATAASPDRRLVQAFNGRPAAEVYAQAAGVDVGQLGPAVFSAHPLVLQAAGGSWIRSIAANEDDGSLSLLAAVDVGEVLRLGRSAGIVEKLEERFAILAESLGGINGVLTFDCVLRRLEFEEHGLNDEMGQILARNGACGFSTYGEQFNGMHMNQTLVAVAFGGSPHAN
ncbi:FIST N-terminal domain-containing protein [Paractinoplanes durhamensis]|uniref:FIST domain containing protein n=1 Tax=Paractinoplanes durhamensis TaxID=113563 RepID=A0ABQ3YRK1_9ACTN|nr:FIST N-terminal domain-containing protein [Actinoplanes durhamensis]GIE00171.1 hypothetical protein Adu01nite_15210 [Actinoplanes durhamensis]